MHLGRAGMDEAATVLCTLITPYKDFCIHVLPAAVSTAPHFIKTVIRSQKIEEELG